LPAPPRATGRGAGSAREELFELAAARRSAAAGELRNQPPTAARSPAIVASVRGAGGRSHGLPRAIQGIGGVRYANSGTWAASSSPTRFSAIQ
jgi:hypothetical protein